MISEARFLAILFAGLVLSGCASTPHHGLDPAARPHLEQVDVHFTIPQYELEADINAAGAGYLIGGIVGGLVNMAIEKERAAESSRLIGPIRDQLINYDHTDALKSLIVSNLEGIDWFNIGSIELHRHSDEERYPTVLESSEAAAVAFIDADYRMTPQFDAISTRVSIIMFPRATALEPFRKQMFALVEDKFDLNTNIYRNTFEVTTVVAHGEDKEENASSLGQPGATIVRDALEKNAVEISRLIVEDLEGTTSDVE